MLITSTHWRQHNVPNLLHFCKLFWVVNQKCTNSAAFIQHISDISTCAWSHQPVLPYCKFHTHVYAVRIAQQLNSRLHLSFVCTFIPLEQKELHYRAVSILIKSFICDFIFHPGKRVRRRDTLPEGATEDVSSQAWGIWAETHVAGTADKQDPTAVSEPPWRQRAPSEATATGKRLSNQRHHQQVIRVQVEPELAETRPCQLLLGFLYQIKSCHQDDKIIIIKTTCCTV